MNKNTTSYLNKIKYISSYNKNNYKSYCFRFHKEYDKEIIAILDAVQNKQGLIKELLAKVKDSD